VGDERNKQLSRATVKEKRLVSEERGTSSGQNGCMKNTVIGAVDLVAYKSGAKGDRGVAPEFIFVVVGKISRSKINGGAGNVSRGGKRHSSTPQHHHTGG